MTRRQSRTKLIRRLTGLAGTTCLGTAMSLSAALAQGSGQGIGQEQQPGGGWRAPGWGTEILRSFPSSPGADTAGTAGPGPSSPGIGVPQSGAQTGSTTRPPAQTKPGATDTPAPNGNTTVITRTPDRGSLAADKARNATVGLNAFLTEAGTPIDQGIVWRVFEGRLGGDGKHKLLSTHKEATPTLRLAAGDYMINAAFGRANLTRKISLKPGEAQTEKFILNAGGLKVSAVLANNEPVPPRTATYDIFSDERDQFGNRAKVMSGARLGLIVRLNAGIYHVVSTYGDANAIEHADITVEAGKLTEALVKHAAAKVTLKLVTTAGGEAMADIRWTITTPEGSVVKETLGALPSHILRAGTYVAVAKQGGQSFTQEFAVQPGEMKQVEVMMQ